jgi:tripartite-type tricarboxylate transporter receptor subunit TctC
MDRINGILAALILALPSAPRAAADTVSPKTASAAHPAFSPRPLRVVVGFPPGGPADTVARLIGAPLGGALRKPIVVQNVPGAAGSIAAERVAAAAPDGHTLGLMTEAQLLINPAVYKTTYDGVRDFVAITQLAAAPYLLTVQHGVRAANVAELIALAKAQPGVLTFGSPGSGSTPHLSAELFKSVAGIDIRHVPYKGIGPALPDLLAGRISMMFTPIAAGLPHVREGKLRALAVTSRRRSPAAPDVPPVADAGLLDFDVTGWLGLVAAAKTPPSVVHALHVEVKKALAIQDVSTKLAALGLEPIGSTPDAFAAAIKTGAARWGPFVRQMAVTPD